MKKTIILLGLLLVMNYTAFAEQRGIFMDFHGDINPKKDTEVNRTPMKLPIEVIYDSDVHTIEVIGNGSLEAEVFCFLLNGLQLLVYLLVEQILLETFLKKRKVT